jgi:phospholipid/cholesterol/gamma-HCH transport system permease protein
MISDRHSTNGFFSLFLVPGARILSVLEFTGFTLMILAKSLYYLKDSWFRRCEIMRQIYLASVRTFLVISVVALFTGMILSLQTGLVLKEFNMEDTIGNVVIASLTREMGPFSAAIIMIAAVGSAMAAEIGTMKVSEEVDALEIMSISPVSYLIMPRVIALTVALPIATVYINAIGTIGGGLIAYTYLGLSFEAFYQRVLESLWFKIVYVGLFKATVFGFVVAGICCAHGLRADGGALGVGKATRNSVVASFLMILILGYYITALFFREG